MSNKHSFTMKLSDLEFVEELSQQQEKAVVGGTDLPDADKLIEDVLDDLSEKRFKAEKEFKKEFPDLAKLIFA